MSEEQNKKVILKIYRTNYNKNDSPYYDKFEVSVKRLDNSFGCPVACKKILSIAALAGIRYSCRMASCGSCGMKINGRPRLACYTKISELNMTTFIVCEPLSNFP